MIRVALVGDGQLARGLARRLSNRQDIRVLGPASRDASLLNGGADLVVIATTTRLSDVAGDIECAVAAGSNVIVSAEEAAFPWIVDEPLATRIDRLAIDQGVTVLGTGLNPGLLFDAFVLTLLGAHDLPRSILIRRVVDLSRFGPAVKARLGLGFSRAEFDAGRSAGRILGHAGFAQSMRVVGDAIGMPVDAVEGQFVPLLDQNGRTEGFQQTYTGSTEGRPWFVAEFVGHIDLARAGLEPKDTVIIDDGAQSRTATIDPGVPSQEGSVSVIANSVDRVIAAPPGWLTVAALPPAHPHTTARKGQL